MQINRFFSILTIAMLALVSIPIADAETTIKRYEGTMGTSPGTAVVWDPCWDIGPDGDAAQNGVDPSPVGEAVCGPFGGHIYLGGVQGIAVPDGISTITTSMNDDNFDSTFWAAVQSDRFDGNGEENSDTWGYSCGSFAQVAVPLPWMSIWVWTIHVDQDTLEVCLGSQGEATVVFS